MEPLAHRFTIFQNTDANVAVTTRHGGVSSGPYATCNVGLHVGDDPAAVRHNRATIAELIDLDAADLVFCNQAHGPNVAVVDASHRGRGLESTATAVDATDALVTTTPGVGLVVMLADCVPVVLHDPAAGVLAVVHAGWGGTVSRIPEVTVQTMVRLGADPGRIRAGIGPAIAPETYEVGEDVADRAHHGLPEMVEQVLTPTAPGKYTFDLWTSNRQLLLGAGLQDAHIELMAKPTGPGTPFFSHRGEGPCGRFATIAALTS